MISELQTTPLTNTFLEYDPLICRGLLVLRRWGKLPMYSCILFKIYNVLEIWGTCKISPRRSWLCRFQSYVGFQDGKRLSVDALKLVSSTYLKESGLMEALHGEPWHSVVSKPSYFRSHCVCMHVDMYMHVHMWAGAQVCVWVIIHICMYTWGEQRTVGKSQQPELLPWRAIGYSSSAEVGKVLYWVPVLEGCCKDAGSSA